MGEGLFFEGLLLVVEVQFDVLFDDESLDHGSSHSCLFARASKIEGTGLGCKMFSIL
jgi:hypothetical protein